MEKSDVVTIDLWQLAKELDNAGTQLPEGRPVEEWYQFLKLIAIPITSGAIQPPSSQPPQSQ